MLTFHGKSSSNFTTIVGPVTKTAKPFYERAKYIYATDKIDSSCLGYKACITSGNKGNIFSPDTIYNVADIDKINENDIVQLFNNGKIYVLWEINSNQNALFMTEACNCHCIMCPQPPKAHDKFHYHTAQCILDLLKNKKLEDICLTGGEPTLQKEEFITTLKRCITEHPKAVINILTNGKTFANRDYVKDIAETANKNVIFCVSLHSDIDTIHDKIVGAKDSYRLTQQGIYNLASFGLAIEIRHVITKLNYQRLLNFAEQLYNYFPFCTHYAFMGMEVCGNAEKNIESIYIEYNEYIQELKKAVLFLHRRGLPVSVYNIPLCLCDNELQKFARQSISSWKNVFLPVCNDCLKKDYCSGFFATSAKKPDNITPFTTKN